jgi:proline iminopeptidase
MSSSTAGPVQRGKHAITIDGVQQVFHVFGTGPLCLAHAGGPGFGWEYLRMPALEQHLTMVYLEPVGTGDSGRLPARRDYRLDVWARFLHGVAGHLGAPRVLVLGHSHGGFVAQRYALEHPDTLAGLILYATSPVLDAGFWAAAMGNLQLFPQQHPDQPEAPGMFGAYQATLAAPDDDAITDGLRRIMPVYFADYWAHEDRLAPVRAAMRAWVDPLHGEEPAPFDVREQLSSIAAPALILTGERDFLCGPRWARELHDGISGSQLTILERSGHMAHLEEPEAFSRAVAGFSANLPPW